MRAWLAMLAWGSVGCAGTSADRDAPPIDAGVMVDAQARDAEADFLAAFRAAFAAYVRGCEDAMREEVDLWEHPLLSGLDESVGEGRYRLDLEHAAECLASVWRGARECRTGWGNGVLERCASVFRGTLGIGERCSTEPRLFDEPPWLNDCAPGLYCSGARAEPRFVCRRRMGVSEACEIDTDCPFSVGQTLIDCRDGTCRARPGPGEPCHDTVLCADGAYCAIDGECWPDPREGEACRRHRFEPLADWCGYDLRCVDGVCAARLGLGAVCGDDYFACNPDLACVDGTCVGTSGTRSGELCYWFDRFVGSTCAPDLVCKLWPSIGYSGVRAGTCQVGVEVGGACDENAPCVRGARCRDGRCLWARGWGESCLTPDTTCTNAFSCLAGRCVPRPLPGQTCDDTRPCARGRCERGVCCLAPDWSPCADEEARGLFPCAGECFDDGFCGRAPWCEDRCGGQTCWLGSMCAPLCSS